MLAELDGVYLTYSAYLAFDYNYHRFFLYLISFGKKKLVPCSNSGLSLFGLSARIEAGPPSSEGELGSDY